MSACDPFQTDGFYIIEETVGPVRAHEIVEVLTRRGFVIERAVHHCDEHGYSWRGDGLHGMGCPLCSPEAPKGES